MPHQQRGSIERFWNIHIYHAEIQSAVETLTDIASRRGLKPVETASGEWIWEMFIHSDSPSWISIFDNEPQNLKNLTLDISNSMPEPVIGLMMNLPVDWGFYLALQGELLGSFSWQVPVPEVDEESMMDTLETQRLVDLGVLIPSQTNQPLLRKRRTHNARIESNDPYLKMKYRARISNNQLLPPTPDLDPALPKKLAELFSMISMARFRKILGQPHLGVQQMVAEFSSHLELPGVFCDLDAYRKNKFPASPERNTGIWLRFH